MNDDHGHGPDRQAAPRWRGVLHRAVAWVWPGAAQRAAKADGADGADGAGPGADAPWLAVLRHLPGGLTRLDRSLRVLFINELHAQWYGHPVAELLGRPLAELMPDERYARLLPHLQDALDGRTVAFENRVELAPGDIRYRYNTMVPERARDGSVCGLISFVIDVTEHKQTELALAEKQAELRGVFEAIPDMVFSRDGDGVYRSCNRAFAVFYGRPEHEILGKTDLELVGAERAAAYRQEDLTALRTGQAYRAEETLRGAVGAGVYDVIKTPVRGASGRMAGIVGVARDVTERKRAEREIERLAFYDTLTLLPNRRLLVSRLQGALEAAEAAHSHGALLFIDLDNFKNLNDTLGHDMGDRLLQLVAERLQEDSAPGRTVARFGGDEFVVVCEHLGTDDSQAAAAAARAGSTLLAALHRPFSIGGRQHHASCSIGIALFGAQPMPADEVLKRADLAVHQAKAAGRNTQRFFDPAMQAALKERSLLEADLRAGLPRDELRLFYQPVVDAAGGILGAEALVRWQHPRRGLVPPLQFIPLAEETGLILPLGEWVLRTACEQLAAWALRPATAALTIAVNVSARQFRHPDFVAQVEAVLQASGAEPQRLKLELTETLLFHDVEDIIGKMARLRDRGVGFSLDDFGTGYSSLGYLKRLPINQLKIDQSFVREVLTDPNDAAIVRTTLTLALNLGLDVIAEGVETAGQLDFLRRHGCRSFQGYLFGRPQPIAEMERQQGLAGEPGEAGSMTA
ncbi:MAG: EAL domain-containing protein [Pseudomonadota bacterium]